MGIGYDTVSSAFDSNLGIFVAICIVIMNTVTTTFAAGVGVPAA
jgi:H+/Cl- antiporter ClcA